MSEDILECERGPDGNPRCRKPGSADRTLASDQHTQGRWVMQVTRLGRPHQCKCTERVVGTLCLDCDGEVDDAGLRAENERLRRVADAARLFLSLPYDNGQHERRLKDELAGLESNGTSDEEKHGS